MATAKFVGKISKMGDRRRIIEIPVDFHSEIKSLEGKQIKITLEDLKL